MSQCVEREEEGSDRPESPTPGCVSMKSDRSKGKPPEPGPSHTQTKRPAKPTTDDEDWKCKGCWIMNTAEDLRCRNCKMTKTFSRRWDSITALPLSAADMMKSWHKGITQSYRDFKVRLLVMNMSTGDPAEDSDLLTDAQNIERNIYESANSWEEYHDLMTEKMSELIEKKLMRMGIGSITALPLSAADMRKSWHKDYKQSLRDYYVRLLVEDMSTGDPAEDIKDLVTDVQNIERNIYESANSRDEYFDLMNEKRSELREKSQKKMKMEQSALMEMKSMDQTSTPPLPPDDKAEYNDLLTEKGSELKEEKLMRMGTGIIEETDFRGHDGGSSSSDSGSGSSIASYSGSGLSLSYDSFTALPLSAADMMKFWHKDFTQKGRDLHVRSLVEDMSTGDPAEVFKNLVTDVQNIERNMYESANSRDEYYKLMNEKRSELREKSQMKMEMEQSGQMEMKSMDQTVTSTPPLPPEDKKQEEEDEEGGAEGESKKVKGQPDVKMEEKPEGTIPFHGEMEEHPVTESQSSLHPSLELQAETDLSSCFSGLMIEESISLPRSHSLPSLRQFPCLENKESFTAKRSHSVNDVTLLDKTHKITPDIIVVENKESYSFHCTQAGLFQCTVTDLVFKMKTEGDVTYRTVHWDRRLLSQLDKRAAGPLFDIKGSQGSVCQLRFPHCEILSMGGGKSLSVLHVMDDDSFELIKPHVITETHVFINVTGLSIYGIVMKMLFWPSPVQALVSLFYTPPIEDDDDPSSILNVLLLPGNVARHDMLKERRSIREEIYIEKPSCELIPNHEYTLSTFPQDDSITIEPNKAKFKVDESSYHNYISTFEVTLEAKSKHVKLLLRHSNTSDCAWERCVKLSAPSLRKQQVQHTLTLPVEDRLFSVRSSFINSVSDPVLISVLDKLLEKGVITKEEYDTAYVEKVKQEKARVVIDTVRNKGTAASSIMILFLCETDPFLSEHLGLI